MQSFHIVLKIFCYTFTFNISEDVKPLRDKPAYLFSLMFLFSFSTIRALLLSFVNDLFFACGKGFYDTLRILGYL